MGRRAPVLALALLALCAAAAHAQETFFGKLQVVAVHGRHHIEELSAAPAAVAHEHHLNLRLKNGGLRRLLFPSEPVGEVRLGGGAVGGGWRGALAARRFSAARGRRGLPACSGSCAATCAPHAQPGAQSCGCP
jgi:hypothetical protein